MIRPLTLLIAVLALALPTSAQAAIAYSTGSYADDGNPQIRVAADDGSGVVTLGVRGWDPVISPDGTRVAYSPYVDLAASLKETRIVTVATGAVVSAGAECLYPAWSPDGSRIACNGQFIRGGIMDGLGVDLIDPATGARTEVVKAKGASASPVSWSPDGSAIAYSTTTAGGNGTSTLHVVRIADLSQSTLGAGANPVWGPARIAFVRYWKNTYDGMPVQHQDIWTVDPARGAGSAKRVTRYEPQGTDAGPQPVAWTPDGTAILGTLIGQLAGRPMKVAVTGGRIATFGPQRAGVFGVAANGATALVVKSPAGTETGTAMAVPLKSSSGPTVARRVYTISVTPSWQP